MFYFEQEKCLLLVEPASWLGVARKDGEQYPRLRCACLPAKHAAWSVRKTGQGFHPARLLLVQKKL